MIELEPIYDFNLNRIIPRRKPKLLNVNQIRGYDSFEIGGWSRFGFVFEDQAKVWKNRYADMLSAIFRRHYSESIFQLKGKFLDKNVFYVSSQGYRSLQRCDGKILIINDVCYIIDPTISHMMIFGRLYMTNEIAEALKRDLIGTVQLLLSHKIKYVRNAAHFVLKLIEMH